jgi:RNA polymerase sigma factor (sigma-70 family)
VAAFERLYRTHAARIHTLARRLLGEPFADDATREIFIRAWRHLETYRGEAAFGIWLSRLGLHLLLDRRKRLSASLEGLAQHRAEEEPVDPRPAEALDCEAALERLPDRAREVLVLHDVEGHAHGEIAGMLGITTGTSKSQLHRARGLLRDLLAGQGKDVRPRGKDRA